MWKLLSMGACKGRFSLVVRAVGGQPRCHGACNAGFGYFKASDEHTWHSSIHRL